MNIAFRVDASNIMGTGHFMRCLTLADKLKQDGADTRFISRHMPEYLHEMLASKGHGFKRLISEPSETMLGNIVHAEWLGTSQESDAQDAINALSDQSWDWLVVDHYALDVTWESILRPTVKSVFVIDDLADRKHDCDMLLDQNYYLDIYTRYLDQVPPHCHLLLGPRYALLREEFRTLHKSVKARTGHVKRMLVFFGGVDAGNYTGFAIQALSNMQLKSIEVDVVIGAKHPNRLDIENLCALYGYKCHVQTLDMAKLMASADLAIGAGGSAAWERCSLGLPALTICTAKNQQHQIFAAAQIGILYGPQNKGDMISFIQRHTDCLIENPSLLKLMSTLGMKEVDGRGVLRVAKEIMLANPVDITVRPAIEDDAALVWSWRNNELTRRYSFDSSAISKETHIAWWNGSLANYKRVLLIGSWKHQACGVIRFDIDANNLATISIYLDPVMTGRGLGRPLILAGISWLRKYHSELITVSAEIIPENCSSTTVFESAGFSEQYRVFIKES